jgi:hypothetical protein
MPLLGPNTDYTDKDFDALLPRLRSLIDSAFSDWTEEERANFGNILVELYAFVGDILTKYQDNQAAEAFIGRVTQRKNILALCKLIGFTARGNTAASADVVFTLATALAGDVSIPARTRVKTENVNDPVVYETTAAVTIPAGSTGPQTVTAENAELREELFSSTGLPNQEVKLTGTPFLDGSLELTAANGSYEVVENLLDSTSTDRHVVVVVDQNDRAQLRFGNGVAGAIPAGTITARYKVGGGAAGRVEANKLRKVEGSFADTFGNAAQLSVNNPSASSVALDRQSVEEIRLLAPQTLRVLERTVSREDFEINAKRVAGVARALMLTSDQDDSVEENTGILFVVPEGGGAPTTDLKAAVLEMVTETYPCTLTFSVTVQDPVYLTVNIEAVVHLRQGYSGATVKAAIEDRLARAFAISPAEEDVDLTVGIDFGYNIRDEDGIPAGAIAWSDVFNVIRDTTGVRKVDGGPAGLLLNGVREDLEIGTYEFPILGTVTIIDGSTGNPL